MGFYESAEKILACSDNLHAVVIRCSDRAFTGFSCRAIYLYPVLIYWGRISGAQYHLSLLQAIFCYIIILDHIFMLKSKVLLIASEGYLMKKWKKPKFKEMRYGFEISMYIMNR